LLARVAVWEFHGSAIVVGFLRIIYLNKTGAGMLKVAVVTLALGVLVGVFAEVTMSGSVAVEGTKKAADYTTGNVDASWVRGEVKAAGKLESGLSGMLHFRSQPNLSAGVKGVDLQPRQLYFKMPVSVVELMAGRWYEVYGNGNNYFGRFLFVGKKASSGSMNTNYDVVDGFKASVKLDAIKSFLNVALLPSDTKFENASLMAAVGGSPIEGLKYTVAGNFQVVTPEGVDGVHSASVNAGYTIMKDLGLCVLGEAAIVNFEEASDNAWFMVGAASKVANILDRVQVEFEIKNGRHGTTDAGDNLCWMLMLQKKYKGLTFDLNVGADPVSLGSQTAGEVGAIFRTTASF